MRKHKRRVLAGLLSALMLAEAANLSGFTDWQPDTVYADMNRQGTVNATTLNVRSGPGTANSIVKKLSYGTAVTVIDETKDSAGTTWYKIRFTSGSSTAEGYASSSYIKFAVSYAKDADFENEMDRQGFPESYKDSLRTLHAEHPTWTFQAQKTGLDWSDVIKNEGAVGANLVSTNSISSWKSTEYGAYDWNTGKWTGFDGASWVAASEEIVAYYMDPRNFLNDIYVFQFLHHSYDSAHQTKDGLQSMIKGTFLEKAITSGGGTDPSPNVGTTEAPSSSGGLTQEEMQYGPGYVKSSTPAETSGGPGAASSETAGTTEAPSQKVSLEGPSAVTSARETQILSTPNVEYGPGMDASSITGDNTGASQTSPVPEGQSYADIIMKAASQSGVNPYVIAAMIIQEQGQGTSGSISGKVSGYEGYYNFFNVGAYQSGSMSAVTRGLWYASQSGSYGRPWNSIEKSIVGGSNYYGENYVKQGQDTFYLKKFNVQGSNLYKHQYMTNIEAAAGEGAKLAKAYTDSMKSQTLVFKIPIYNNMPESACAKPTMSGSPNNKLSNISVTGYTLTPTFNKDTESYDIIVNPSVEKIEVAASAIDSKATVSGIGIIDLQSGNNTVSVQVQAENGQIRTYKLNVVRQSGAPSVNVSGSSTNSGTGTTAGPTASSGPIASGSTSGPGAVTAETTAAADFSGNTNGNANGSGEVGPGVTSSADVAVGVGPGGSSGNTGVVKPETTAPAETTAPPTAAPETAAPETNAPETQAPTEAAKETSAAADLKKGDLNGDGKTTLLDLILIKKQILGQNVLSDAAKKAADLDGDGKITAADAAALQNMI